MNNTYDKLLFEKGSRINGEWKEKDWRWKKKVGGKLKAFLLLTGASAVGLPVFAVLHNLVYALFILWFGENFWGNMGDEPVFFILAVIVCPIAFLAGVVGTIVLDAKNKQDTPAETAWQAEANKERKRGEKSP